MKFQRIDELSRKRLIKIPSYRITFHKMLTVNEKRNQCNDEDDDKAEYVSTISFLVYVFILMGGPADAQGVY